MRTGISPVIGLGFPGAQSPVRLSAVGQAARCPDGRWMSAEEPDSRLPNSFVAQVPTTNARLSPHLPSEIPRR